MHQPTGQDTDTAQVGQNGPVSNAQLTKNILRMAGPVLLAMLTQTLINVADTFFVGKLDSSMAVPGQAALGYSLPLLWIVGGFLAAIGVGTQVITARRFGNGDRGAAGQVLTNSLIIAVSTGAAASVAAWFAAPSMFGLLTSDPDVLREGVPYIRWRFLGVLSMVSTMALKAFFDGVGRTHVHMVAAFIMNITNLVLNYCLIFGVGPFPEMFVEGAGLASLIATYVGLVVMVLWTLTPSERRDYGVYTTAKINTGVMGDLIKLSVPSGLATLFVMTGLLLFLKIIGLLDASLLVDNPGRPALYTAAAKVILDIGSLGFISALAFGTATATLVSQSLGSKRPNLAARYGWGSVFIYATLMTLCGAVMVFAPEVAMDLISDDAQVIKLGAPGMRIIGAVMPLVAVGVILTQALFGAGNTRFVMIAEMLLHFICLVPLTYILALGVPMGDTILGGFGFIGVWLACGTYIALLALVMGWKFWEGSWKSIEV